MIRYTEPTEEYSIHGIDLTGGEIYVTYRQGNVVETFRPTNIAYDAEVGTTFEVGFSQLETAGLAVGNADVQINYILDGKRSATKVKTVYIGEQLLEKELP